jgi:hypothetical protein
MIRKPVYDIAKGEREQVAAEVDRLRHMSDRERGQMIKAVCRAAAKIHAGRIKSGLPPATPDPWPESTWEFLRRSAANARRN